MATRHRTSDSAWTPGSSEAVKYSDRISVSPRPTRCGIGALFSRASWLLLLVFSVAAKAQSVVSQPPAGSPPRPGQAEANELSAGARSALDRALATLQANALKDAQRLT